MTDDPDATRFHPASELERDFLRVITRGYPAIERQIDMCLVSQWDDGYLDVRVMGSDPFDSSRRIVLGPFVHTGRDDVLGMDCLCWTDGEGFLINVEVAPVGFGTVEEPMSFIVQRARSEPGAIAYRLSERTT